MSEPQEQMTDEALADVQDGADAVATPDEGAGATLAAAPDEAMSPEAAPSQDEDATIAADAPEQGHAQEDAAEYAAPEEAAQDGADGEPEEAPADDQPSEGAAEDAAPEEAAQDGADGESEATPANDQPSEGAAEGAATEEGAAQDQPLEDTVSQEVSTAHMPHVDPADRDEVDPSLGDVARTAGKYARGRMDKVREFFATHLVVVGVSCVCLLVAIFAAVMFARDLASMPEIGSVERDARDHLSTANYEPGEFGSDERLALTSVSVSGRQKAKDDINSCTATVNLLYANNSVQSSQRATLGYVRKDGIWECIEASSPTDTISSATNGVSDSALLGGIDSILRKAETSFKSPEEGASSLSLLTLYRDAEITVVDRFFDESAQTYDAKLHLKRTSTFTAYECTVTASFTFRQGTGVWELTKANASSGAKEVVLTPLIGTWQGAFQAQTSSDAKCFGAKEGGITINITSVDAGKISGTFSGLAHFHTPPQADADNNAEDVAVTDVSFEGKVDATSSGISFTCTTPEDARGRLTLRLDFGSPDNPESATASLTSEFDYEDILLFIPYDRTATFTDSFTLTKA